MDVEREDYPPSLDKFIGQRKAKTALRNWIAASQRNQTRLPHLLLTGPTGLGKSALAKVVADEMGVTFRKVSPGKARPQNVLQIIRGDIYGEPPLKARDILLIEEAHAAFHAGESPMAWLLDTMLEFTIDGEAIPEITFVLATHVGVRHAAFRGRLREIRLEPYTHREAVELVYYYADKRLGPWPPPTAKQAAGIARAGSHNPRRIIAILDELRVCTDAGDSEPTEFEAEQYDLGQALWLLDLTRDGLDQLARNYLKVLSGIGGIAGETTMQSHLAETHLEEVETLLVEKGLLRRTARGRELTEAGTLRAAKLLIGRTW